MNLEDKLAKKDWKRRVSSQLMLNKRLGGAPAYSEMKNGDTVDQGQVVFMQQKDFMNELNVGSHRIFNINYKSNRPKYKYDTEKQKNVFDGYQDVSRVGVALQSSIRRKKAVSLFGFDVWFGNEGTADKTDEISYFKSMWNISGMRNTCLLWAMSFLGVGDGAIYLYIENGRIKSKVFSFEHGDVYNYYEDPITNEVEFLRQVNIGWGSMIEVYKKNTVEKWILSTDDDEFIKRGIGWKEVSSDNYRLVDVYTHGLGMCPVIYHREQDVPWADGQPTIERIEDIMSDLAENNKYYAFQILFLTGGSVDLPEGDYGGKVLGGATEGADAKILAPADCSNSFTIDIQQNLSFLYEVTSTTEVNPKDLKGGDYSGAYIRNLYFRDVQWATEAASRLENPMRNLIDLFSILAGKLKKKPSDYENLPISYKIMPFVPENELEEATILTMYSNSGTMSTQTITEENRRSNPEEMARIRKEALEKAKNEQIKEDAKKLNIPSDVGIDNRTKSNNLIK